MNRLQIRTIKVPETDRQLQYGYIGLPATQEALFLVNFTHNSTPRVHSAVDLGTGCGLCALAWQCYRPDCRTIGIDIQADLIRIANENARNNCLDTRIDFMQGDLRCGSDIPSQHSTDLVIINPPFRKTMTGKTSPVPERRTACHEFAAGLTDYIDAARHILRHHGIISLVFLPERLTELFVTLARGRLEPYLMRAIHHKAGNSANAVMVLARKDGKAGLRIQPPLIVH